MNSKIVILTSGLLLVTAFAIGRYTAPATAALQKSTEQDDSKTHTQVTVTTTKSPTGEVKTVVVKDIVSTTAATKTEKVEAPVNTTPAKKFNVSALVAVDVKDLKAPDYGVLVTKQIAGPITAGVFGMTNGNIGISIGLDF